MGKAKPIQRSVVRPSPHDVERSFVKAGDAYFESLRQPIQGSVLRPSPRDVERSFVEAGDAYFESLRQRLNKWGQISPVHEHSLSTYASMWTAFAVFCADMQVPLDDISRSHIEDFLNKRSSARGARAKVRNTGLDADGKKSSAKPAGTAELTPRHKWRIVRLIDHVLEHSARVRGKPRNDAARQMLDNPDLRFVNTEQNDPLPVFLRRVDAERVIGYCKLILRDDECQKVSWQEVRNRALVATVLGAGLTPLDVRKLRLEDVITDTVGAFGLRVKGNGNSPARETPIAEWARVILERWIWARAVCNVKGDLMFPSTASGDEMSKQGLHVIGKNVLAAAGVSPELAKGGLYCLRHSFAVRQIVYGGKSEKEVARFLGITDASWARRYARTLEGRVTGLV